MQCGKYWCPFPDFVPFYILKIVRTWYFQHQKSCLPNMHGLPYVPSLSQTSVNTGNTGPVHWIAIQFKLQLHMLYYTSPHSALDPLVKLYIPSLRCKSPHEAKGPVLCCRSSKWAVGLIKLYVCLQSCGLPSSAACPVID